MIIARLHFKFRKANSSNNRAVLPLMGLSEIIGIVRNNAVYAKFYKL